jgi:hypothetical protein
MALQDAGDEGIVLGWQEQFFPPPFSDVSVHLSLLEPLTWLFAIGGRCRGTGYRLAKQVISVTLPADHS